MKIDDIRDKAVKSYGQLYGRHGIRPNAWIMSIDILNDLSQDIVFEKSITCESDIDIDIDIKFMGNPVYIVKGGKEIVKAIIQEDE